MYDADWIMRKRIGPGNSSCKPMRTQVKVGHRIAGSNTAE